MKRFLFSIISIIFISGLIAPHNTSAATVQQTSNVAQFLGSLQTPKTVSFNQSPYNVLGIWYGTTLSDVSKQQSTVLGLNAVSVNAGVLFGTHAMEQGFPVPAGTGDNVLAVENDILVSDYGQLSSTLVMAFVEGSGSRKPATTTRVGIYNSTQNSASAFLYDKNLALIKEVPLTSFTGITSSTPIFAIVIAYAVPQGSGLRGIVFEKTTPIQLSVQPPTPPKPPSGTNENTNGDGNTDTTPGKVLGESIFTQAIMLGAKAGAPPEVRLYSTDGNLISRFNAYEEHFTGGVQVGMGDIDGDGTVEIITAPGRGSAPNVRIFDTNGRFITGFFAYDIGFHGGVNLAVADIEGDGKFEIVTAPKAGGGPNVRIFGFRDGSIIPTTENFMAYAPEFRGGVSIALGDIDGDGEKDIVTAPESSGGPHLRIFSFKLGIYRPSILALMAYGESFRGGIEVTAGDMDGDGRAEVVTGIIQGGGPHIRIF